MTTGTAHSADDEVCISPHYRPRFPHSTLKCVGRPLYRSQQARDYACLLDLDPKVSAWRCMPQPIVNDSGARNPRHHYVDFAVETESEALLVDVRSPDAGIVSWIARLAEKQGYRYQVVSLSEFGGGPRLQNARDLIRYAGYGAPLGDRIRILAVLEEMGTLTLAECLSVVRESKPMPTIATMILMGILEVDLDEALLGPETVVRRAAK
ncbi:MAG TPA: hypothetical protein VK181_01390 [Rhizobium sp.]|nr:hypothetical protein [Rhizobium sp.]